MTDRPAHDPHATGDGAVMLDIGGDIGAVVVVFPDALLGREVEIVPADGAATGPAGGFHAGELHPAGAPPHVGIVPRTFGPEGPRPTAVLGDLSQGHYRLSLVTHHHHHGDDDHGHSHDDDAGHDHPHDTADDVVVDVEVVGGQIATVTWPGA